MLSINIDKSRFICPITDQLFLNPVLANDGIYYEKEAIEKWLKVKKTSPMTREKIRTITDCKIMKQCVEAFIEMYPENRSEQYKEDLKEHQDFLEEVDQLIDDKDYDELLKYTNFDIHELNTYELFLRCENILVLKHIIDHAIDLEECIDGCYEDDPTKLIHVINYQLNNPYGDWEKELTPERLLFNEEIMLYLVEKGAELDSIDQYGEYPIHEICRYSTYNVIKSFIDHDVDLSHTVVIYDYAEGEDPKTSTGTPGDYYAYELLESNDNLNDEQREEFKQYMIAKLAK